MPSARGWAASFAGSRPSCVRGPVQGGEAGSRNLCSGRERPAVPRLREELQRVRSQVQVRPVDQRITWTQEFSAREQKRVEGMRTDLVKAQEANVKAQETLRHEEALLRVSQCGPVPPVTPVHFATELATLRECVQELRERRVECRIVCRRRPRRESVQENQDFGNSCAKLDVAGDAFTQTWLMPAF